MTISDLMNINVSKLLTYNVFFLFVFSHIAPFFHIWCIHSKNKQEFSDFWAISYLYTYIIILFYFSHCPPFLFFFFFFFFFYIWAPAPEELSARPWVSRNTRYFTD